MSKYFRVESLGERDLIKVYSKNSQKLPIEFDCNERFSVYMSVAEQYLDKIHDFEVRKDDVWVITQPKSGTTWMLELVWLLENNLDFETALRKTQTNRIPFLEVSAFLPTLKPDPIDAAAVRPSPRIIKSHLPIHLLPIAIWEVKPKIIFVTRNPLDAMVSFYYHQCTLGYFNGPLEEHIKLMMENRIRSTPFGVSTLEYWQLRHEPYVYFTSYERMKLDLRSEIVQLCKFLNRENVVEDQMVKLLDHLSFEKMKKNAMCNHADEIQKFRDYTKLDSASYDFIRSGKVNSFKTELSEESQEKVKKWYEEQLNKYGLNYDDIFFSKKNII